jgi:hypothetical protein
VPPLIGHALSSSNLRYGRSFRVGAGTLCLLAAACGGEEQVGRCLSDAERAASGWAPAERLFRGDPFWMGGDAAYSIDLGRGRILWLFGDSFISPEGAASRSGAPFARNTIAIQQGYDPSSATMAFHFRRDSAGNPIAFFESDTPETWLWPGHGARLSDALFIFLWRVRSTPGEGLGFRNDAPTAVLIANPDDDPVSWRIAGVPVPANPWGVFLGTGAVVVEGGYLHALSCVEPGNHDVYAARWPIAAVANGQLDDPEWATGDAAWTRQSALAGPPRRLFAGGHTEFSVSMDATIGEYVQIQATGFPGEITMRTAPALTGPWSGPRVVYRPPELGCSGALTYAAKAHPALVSPELAGRVALSYASNSTDFWTLVSDLSLYFPRFIRLDVQAAIATP